MPNETETPPPTWPKIGDDEWPKVGDKVRMQVRPPLTWWDRLLWRLFRIERERPLEWADFVVTGETSSDPEKRGYGP